MLGLSITPATMHRLWIMLAHYHGQIVNCSALGQSLDLSDKSVKRYIDILQGTFMVRILQPWQTNVGKRLTILLPQANVGIAWKRMLRLWD
jgi:predicted AAA+ superfamily ATPase